MQTQVKIFKGSINEVEEMINDWASRTRATIQNASISYDEKASYPGAVFVLVVYEAA